MYCERSHLYNNRVAAAVELLEILPKNQMKQEEWEIVAVSSGGLVVANVMCQKLKLPLRYLFSEGIYAPNNSECEIARVSETQEIVIHEALANAFEIKVDYIYGEAHRKYEDKILSKMFKYRKGDAFQNQEGKSVLLVDEGCEGGLKLMAAVKTVLQMNPKAVYVATPIIPTNVLELLEPLVDEVYYGHSLRDYIETKCYYESFEQVSDEEIEFLLGNKKEQFK